MFSFFRKKTAGKPEAAAPETPEHSRALPNDTAPAPAAAAVAPRAKHENDVTNDKNNTIQKDVVNLLIPRTDYHQKAVGGLFHNIMPGKKRRNRKNRIQRAESCREISPQKEMPDNLQRSLSELDKTYKQEVSRSADDVSAPTQAKNIPDDATADHADFVKALVLQKYGAHKSPIDSSKQHVSLVYVSDEPTLAEKRHAETLLREIARSIDCTIDQLNAEKGLMGATGSKNLEKRGAKNEQKLYQPEPVYEDIDDIQEDSTMRSFKEDLKGELEKLLLEQNNNEVNKNTHEDTATEALIPKKSNLKPPKSDTEGCSDDDRSDNGKKRITFSKHIVFDDGDRQTDEEVDSSFESLTSEEVSEEEVSAEEDLPDNDEMLGGVVVSRSEQPLHEETNENDTGQTTSDIKITVETSDDDQGELKRISSDNSDSGFLDISDKNNSSDDLSSEVKTLVESSESEVESEVESETASEVTESETEEEEEVDEEIVEEEEEEEEEIDAAESQPADKKTLVSQESKFQHQVTALSELADARCGEAQSARDLIAQYRKEIEAKDLEIERLKCDLASAYKESELIRQRSRSLEEELGAARTCSADLADQLHRRNDEALRQLRSELDAAVARGRELEAKVLALEQERDRIEQEKRLHEEKAAEALATSEANTAKWRQLHEAARSQAAARAERMLADCEWKMRELEKRARDAERNQGELTVTLEAVKAEKAQPSPAQMAELQQLRTQASEQQRSVHALTLQLQKVETREEALKLEVHRLRELLDKEARIAKEKEDRHYATIERLGQQHSKALETSKAELAAAAATSRATLERAHAERTRTALAQLRADAEKDARNADRKLREVTTRFENLKELLETKEAAFERAIAEAHSKADWELLQLRHLLDKGDIAHANNMDRVTSQFEAEKESLIAEWTEKLKTLEEESSEAQEEAKKLLEQTRNKLVAEKNDTVNKLKDQHRKEMEEQWERFMSDKESCLARMKMECRQEGEEDRAQREKELLEELAELRALVQSKETDLDTLTERTAACGRTLAVTEQELREALARERELREKRSEDGAKIRQLERAAKDQVEHLTRKCACLKKLFDDMRARLSTRERAAEQEAKAREKEINQLKAEVARLTKLLLVQNSPTLGARTRADGCETAQSAQESFLGPAAPAACETQPNAPRRKGGTLRTPEPIRKHPTLPSLAPLAPESRPPLTQHSGGRRRAKSVDLPAVQVPCRIRQLQELVNQ